MAAPKKPRRFSIAAMLGIILLFGVGFAALRAASKPWAAVLASFTALMLALALLCVALRRGRVFWTGFAVFGWTYAVLTWGMIRYGDPDESYHPTVAALEWSLPWLHPEPPPVVVINVPDRHRAVAYDPQSYITIGHNLACLGFALLGACLASVLSREPISTMAREP